jgi:hypothetical protein
MEQLKGSRISLISHKDVRYEGILFEIKQDSNPASIVMKDGM